MMMNTEEVEESKRIKGCSGHVQMEDYLDQQQKLTKQTESEKV